MPQADPASLWDFIEAAGLTPEFSLSDGRNRVALAGLAQASSLGLPLAHARGKSVIIHAQGQLSAALAAIELDGIARKIVLCPPDLAVSQLPWVIADAKADILLTEQPAMLAARVEGIEIRACGLKLAPHPARAPRTGPVSPTQWLLFTSGTTGRPKMVVHTLQSLTGPLAASQAGRGSAKWSTFYDIRRYGGLQILLRALLSGAPLALSAADEPVGDFLARLGAFGVTHLSGTPSHWRRALMSPMVAQIAPSYIRLSGEIADQAVLNHLRAAFPAAAIAHAFASTEAGVAFEVNDGLAGFPAEWAGRSGHAVEMRIIDGSLRLRSARLASAYAGDTGRRLADAQGFVDTGDTVALRDGRYHFTGRQEGVINVGGLKVHPEEVEAIVNLHPNVRMSRVKGRRSPITGAIVVADIVREDDTHPFARIRDEILASCREFLPNHKVPAFLYEVPSLELNAAGKLLRNNA